jgi:hypothetical protein
MAEMTKPLVVFCGPTITAGEVSQNVDAICLPPAVQGSFVAAVQEFGPEKILLIDGGFQSEPAVKHKEILWAISRGVTVVGASSMGALRAVELAPWMLGVGMIYRWYRRWQLAPDDAVAVLHTPEEMGLLGLTESLLDLRLTFKSALRSRAIDVDQQSNLAHAACALNFRDRTLDRVIAEAFPQASPDEAAHMRTCLKNRFVRQKHRDALRAIQFVKEITFAPIIPRNEFVMTRAFLDDIRLAGMSVTE